MVAARPQAEAGRDDGKVVLSVGAGEAMICEREGARKRARAREEGVPLAAARSRRISARAAAEGSCGGASSQQCVWAMACGPGAHVTVP